MTEIADMTTFRLANEADCTTPDNADSAGSQFLDQVRDAFLEAVEYNEGKWDADDGAHTIADAAVPIYTRDVWTTFVDLGAYTEDPSELGADVDDMEQAAKICLYMIAERLCYRLAELLDEGDDDD